MDIALETLRSSARSASTASATAERRRAASALVLASLAGVATQALFWRTGVGLNFWLWDLAVVGATVALLRRGRLAPTAWGAIAACVTLGFSIVRFESQWSFAIAVPWTVALLALLPWLVRERLTLADVGALPARAIASLRDAPGAAREVARLPGVAAGDEGRGVFHGVARGLLFGVPVAGLFTLLLASDADFTRVLGRVQAQIGDATAFAVWSAIGAVGYLFGHALHRRRAPARESARPIDRPYRELVAETSALYGAPAVPTPRVSVLTWSLVVGQVALVFALFVAANLRHLFGGKAFVRSSGGLTYATYLHSGFAQLLFATILSVCLVLAGHALLRPWGAPKGAAVPGGKLLAALEAALLVLSGVTVASCWQRLHIYEDAYGASHLRLGVAFVELSVLGVLAITSVKVLARRWTGYAGAVVAFSALVAVVASAFNADAYVARTNLDRAAAGRSLDETYLVYLSGDARDALDHPYVQANPALAAKLAKSLCAPRAGDVRSFRGLGRCHGGAR